MGSSPIGRPILGRIMYNRGMKRGNKDLREVSMYMARLLEFYTKEDLHHFFYFCQKNCAKKKKNPNALCPVDCFKNLVDLMDLCIAQDKHYPPIDVIGMMFADERGWKYDPDKRIEEN